MKKLLVAAFVLAVSVVALPAAEARPKTVKSYTYVEAEPRDHWLFVPEGKVPKGGRPMVVYLHGCTQRNTNDPRLAFGTKWNELALEVGAVVLYPLQDPYDMENPEAVEGNGSSCWNWFLDKNHHRDRGEPAQLAALTLSVAEANHVDLSRVYVMGTSAGASMANILATTHPDVFRAAAMLAGCGYAACADATGRLAYKELGDNGFGPVPAIVFQGTGDMLSNAALGEDLLRQQLGTHDWADDASFNQSVELSSTEHHGDATAVRPDREDNEVCVGDHSNWPCAAGITGWESYPYTVERYVNASGNAVVDRWLIHGLNHNYPNGNYESTFTDPAGPDITRAAWEFFTRA